jgi:hypothetical protein
MISKIASELAHPEEGQRQRYADELGDDGQEVEQGTGHRR